MTDILTLLRKFPFTRDVEVLDIKVFRTGFYLKIKVSLIDSSVLFIREYVDSKERSYSYHWQKGDGRLLMRWDNAPHHPEVITFPHHKHVGGRVVPSYAVTVDDILKEIEAKIKKA